MAKKIDTYRERLRAAKNVDALLKRHSNLPGPRGNVELAHAFALEGATEDIWRFAGLGVNEAPENTPRGFLAFCGVLGLGRLIVEGDARAAAKLVDRASDPRWRVREAVATALQIVGDRDRRRYLSLITQLAAGGPLQKRAAVAAIAEPRLLTGATLQRARRVIERVTRSFAGLPKPLGEEGKVLRQGLAYAWSVIVAADPDAGKGVMEVWLRSPDPDIAWIMKRNLAKKRLQKADPAWCAQWQSQLDTAVRSRKSDKTKRPKGATLTDRGV